MRLELTRREKPVHEGRKEGRKEGSKEGRKEARKQGKKEGRKEGKSSTSWQLFFSLKNAMTPSCVKNKDGIPKVSKEHIMITKQLDFRFASTQPHTRESL